MDRKTRVFVYETTSADPLCVDAALASQGRSMRNAMVADLAMLDDVAVTLSSDVDESLPARVQQVCRPPGIPALDFLRNQAALHDFVWVVAPESGGMLASLRAASEDRQWLGCGGRAIAIASSKRATAAALRTAGIAATEPFEAGIGLDVDPDERIASGSVASTSCPCATSSAVSSPVPAPSSRTRAGPSPTNHRTASAG